MRIDGFFCSLHSGSGSKIWYTMLALTNVKAILGISFEMR